MKYAYPLGCAMLALLAQAAWAQNAAPAPTPAPAPKTVIVNGCPKLSTEGGCTMVTNKKGATYNINAANPKPDLGKLGIQVKGTVVPGQITLCGGTTLKDITWKYTKQDCSH